MRSEGLYLWTSDGEQFMNCGGYGVFLLGARHPRVVRAVAEQLAHHPVASRSMLEPCAGAAAAALAEITPAGLSKIYFAGAGTEAVEAGIKIAVANGAQRLISTENSYHGKTLGSLALTGSDQYQDPFRAVLPVSQQVRFGDIDALERTLGVGGPPACVVLEPIQGEGGVVVPPTGYLAGVQSLCRERGALLVIDEIQTGLGRTGSWWACDREQVIPDVLLTGKSLGGGVLPVSAAVTNEALFAPFDADMCLHTSTFSASPLAMAAVTETLATIRDENLIDRSAAIGAQLVGHFKRIQRDICPDLIAEIRGAGLLIGIEFVRPDLAAEFLALMLDSFVILNHSLNTGSVARLTPPAIMNQAEVSRLVTAVENACHSLRASARTDGRTYQEVRP